MITKEKLDLYKAYDGEYALLFEPWANIEDRDRISGQEFAQIDQLISNLQLMKNGKIGEPLIHEINVQNSNIRDLMTDEVYKEIVAGLGVDN